MANTPVCIVGNIATKELVLREGRNGGKPYVLFNVGVNSGERGSDNEKSDFYSIKAYGNLAANIVESLGKGSAVIIQAYPGSYEKDVHVLNKDGELVPSKATMTSFTAAAVGPNLMFATAEVTKNPSRGVARVEEDVEEDEAPRAKAAPRAAATTRRAPAAAVADDEF
ncbi:single-stranded DNA-binding protein [Tersicoccus sp. MR15.9]|uniref:single-stranded DNA-binding protein n=1 Tax=Tersicoccus mangrovi TaxID=3121635 RepID=UPI002FE6593C